MSEAKDNIPVPVIVGFIALGLLVIGGLGGLWGYNAYYDANLTPSSSGEVAVIVESLETSEGGCHTHVRTSGGHFTVADPNLKRALEMHVGQAVVLEYTVYRSQAIPGCAGEDALSSRVVEAWREPGAGA